jgi:hypothetical protein
MVHVSPQKSTRQQLVKVSQVPCLYRHVLNRGYYGIKKVGGKRKEHSLKTTDRKLAERRLKVWLENLEKIDTSVERLTLQELVEKLQKANAVISILACTTRQTTSWKGYRLIYPPSTPTIPGGPTTANCSFWT